MFCEVASALRTPTTTMSFELLSASLVSAAGAPFTDWDLGGAGSFVACAKAVAGKPKAANAIKEAPH
jgi:hypothetical protein